MKYIQLLLFWCSLPIVAQSTLSTTEIENIHHSYHAILQKFESSFIALGEGKGYAMPAVLIDTSVVYKHEPLKKGLIRFGDVPVYQGFYLSVLATDFVLSNKKNISFLNKMYFVLKSKKRLDSVAEIQLYKSKIEHLDKKEQNKLKSNGFFIRDDIDKKTAQQLFKQAYLRSDTEFLEAPLKNAMSQDQVIGWLMGYCFVIYALQDSESKKAKEVLKMAENQLTTLLQFMKNNKWMIRDPIEHKMVARGPYAKFQAYPMVEIGKQYLGMNFDTPITNGLGKLAWYFSEIAFKWCRRVTIADRFNNKKRYLIFGDITNSMVLKLAALSNTWQPKRMAQASMMANLEIYELISAYFCGRKPLIAQSRVEGILQTITPKGAFYYGNHYKATGGWASRDRWSHPGDRFDGNDFFKGNYPGLDFLLLRNLYLLTYQNAQ